MNEHPISRALHQLDVQPSAAFRDGLRAEFVSALSNVDAVTEAEHGDDEEKETVTLIDTASLHRDRSRIIVGIAAALVAAVALTAVILNRRADTNVVDTSHDQAIAGSALITADDLGAGWRLLPPGPITSRTMANIASTVPECDPYLDAAFNTEHRKVVTLGRGFKGRSSVPLLQFVYLYESEAAATGAMDKIAEPGFATCFNKFIDALTPVAAPGQDSVSTTITPPPFTAHGERQIVLGQSVVFKGISKYKVMNFFVQVGRGIVYVDPTADANDDLGPTGQIEKTVAAATAALAAALESK